MLANAGLRRLIDGVGVAKKHQGTDAHPWVSLTRTVMVHGVLAMCAGRLVVAEVVNGGGGEVVA